ncbi:MAG: AMP-binding protein [bacterium]|nr:AMP-binding protein [bacterium]
MTGCGYPFRGTDIAILDDRGESLPEREVGEIAVRSGTLFSGYYLAPEAAEGAFHDGWFRTGDVGYVAGGQLFVCDRKKDLIISGGRNLHPRAIESIAEAVFGESAGRCAAFGVADPVLGTEVPVLVIEKRRDMDGAAEERMLLRVRQSVFRDLELVLADVRIVPRGWLVKTTSGKLARAASREKYIAQGYDHASGGFPFSPDDLAPERLPQTAARLFEMVIGIGGVGPDDDFIRLGGDSLSAFRLFAEVEKLFGMRISTLEFFRRPTARCLADILRRGADGGPSGEAVTQQQLAGEGPQPGPGIGREAPLTDPDDDIRESSLAGMKPPGLAYRLRLRFMTRLLGHEWAQRMFRPAHSLLIRRFYALVDGPAQSEREAVRCGLICDSPGRFQDDLLNQIVSHGPGCWSLNTDMASLERAHREGRGVILAGRHAGLALLIREFTLDRLKPNGYFFIKMVPGMIFGESAVPPGPERKRLRLSFFMDQLMEAKRVLSGGGVVFVLPDGGAGLSRGVSLPFHGRMRNFKTGFAELAVETGAPVVPVSMGIDVLAREVTLAFREPMDIGPADLPHAERVEGLVRKYAAYLDEEWKRFPGSVALKQKEAHLKMRPAGR